MPSLEKPDAPPAIFSQVFSSRGQEMNSDFHLILGLGKIKISLPVGKDLDFVSSQIAARFHPERRPHGTATRGRFLRQFSQAAARGAGGRQRGKRNVIPSLSTGAASVGESDCRTPIATRKGFRHCSRNL